MASDHYSTVDIIWISLFSFMLTVAVFGNALVIWIVLAHRRMRTVTNYFLLNLSVADLTMAILNGAPNFFYMLRNDWIFGEILCVVNNFVANFTVASCVFTMMAISIDRWIAVMHPLEPRMKKRSAWKAIGAIWLGSALLAAPALVYSKTILYSTGARSCMVIWPDGKTPDESVYDLAYNVVLLVVTYVIPMTAMAICYGTMSWELWGHTHIGEVTERQRNSMISKRKVVRMFIIVVLSFAICWLPYHGYFIYMYYDKTLAYKNWAQPLYLSFYFLAMSTSMINPVVYYFMNSRFRNYIQETMKNFCCCRRRQSDMNRRFLQETPPLLRHCHNYSQSCSRSRSGDDNNCWNDHHHHNHHHHHHPRLNPHHHRLNDRIPINNHHANNIKVLNRPYNVNGTEILQANYITNQDLGSPKFSNVEPQVVGGPLKYPVVKMEHLPRFLQQLGSVDKTEKLRALGSLIEIMPQREEIIDEAIKRGILNHLLPMLANAMESPLEMKTLELLTRALDICSYARRRVIKTMFNEPGLLSNLIILLQKPNVQIKSNALAVIGNMVCLTKKNEDDKRVLKLGILKYLKYFLHQRGNALQAVRLIFNLTVSFRQGVDALLKSDLLKTLVEYNLQNGEDEEKKDAVGIIKNITRLGTAKHVAKLKATGVWRILDVLVKTEYKEDAEVTVTIQELLETLRET